MSEPRRPSFRFSGKRLEALEALRRREGVRAPAAERIPRRPPAADPPPLSFAQQRLWLVDQLDPGTPAYNMAFTLRLRGRLSVAALRAALEEIVRRHEVLRTSFPRLGGEARQSIAPEAAAREVPLPVIDLAGLAAGEAAAEALRRAAELAAAQFDLAAGPVLRAALLRLAPEDWMASFNLHHIAGDGWSLGVLVRELAALYRAAREGRPSPLPELPVQYADFAVWQREALRGPALEGPLAAWRRDLESAPALLDLPADRPRPPERSFRGGQVFLAAPDGPLAGLRRLAREEGATLFMVLLAGFQALLHRLTGAEDLLVGSPVANRTRSELEGLIGFFVNNLVLRGRPAPLMSFREMAARAKSAVAAAYERQELPFEKLVEGLRVERGLDHSPLFQVVFSFQNAPAGPLELPDVTLEPVALFPPAARFDLSVAASEAPEGLVLSADYRTDLFDPPTVARLLESFQILLEGAAADPGRRLADLPLLTAAAAHQLAVEWNDTRVERSADGLAPRRLAALLAEGRLPGTLARRTAVLARHLRELGVGPEKRVGIYAGASPEAVAGVLAVLASGGAWVALDPALPAERLDWMARDAGITVVLVAEGSDASLPAGLPRLPLGSPLSEEGRSGGEETEVLPESAAYVLYTSGSTGRPKGTVIGHDALANYLAWVDEALAAAGPLPWTSSLAFDASLKQVLAPVLRGEPVWLPGADASRPAELLARLGERSGAALNCVPSLWRALLDLIEAGQGGGARGLRSLLLGGEALDPGLAARTRAALPGLEVWNLYGPTEATANASLARVGERSPRIGRPIANASLHVVDRGLALLPVGAPGELAIGGRGLARGYLNRPGLTAELFVPDPFGGEPGARLYRTGDLVRRRPDGELEYRGRLDSQLKVRGFRVEPGEVEAALAAHPAVAEAAVVAREDPGVRLVAYVAPRREETVTPAALRGFLRARLPLYMLPAEIVVLAALPLNPHGKVDRAALPPPPARSGTREGEESPRSPAEEVLARLWEELLGLDRVTPQDNFFEVGGDSILAIQIVARAARAGLRLTPRQLFEHQTLAELAAVAQPAAAAPEPLEPLSMVPGPVPLTPIQRLFFSLLPEEPCHFTQAVLLTVAERLPARVLEGALDLLVRRHDALRLRFHRREGGEGDWLQEVAAPGEPPPFLRVDLGALPAGERSTAITAACAALQADLLPERAPVLRLARFELGPGAPDRLLVAVHHLAVDGVSWRVLLPELEAACRALAVGEAPELPPPPVSFRRWADHLAAEAAGRAREAELRFWLARAEAPPLPRDFPGGLGTAAEAASVEVELDEGDTAALLRDLPRVFRARADEALLAALTEALCGWSGAALLRVDLESHGRGESPDLDPSGTVGWLTARFPLALERGGSPLATLAAVKERLRGVPDRGVGYGVLRWLAGREELAGPAPEVSFNYLGQLDAALAGASLFAPAPEPAGPSLGARWPRRHLFEIDGGVFGGRLRLAWTFPPAVYRRETVEALAGAFRDRLRELIRLARVPGAWARSPSDFPLARLAPRDLERLAAGGPIEDAYPLSPLQRGLLFHSLESGGGEAAYLVQHTCRLEGDLDAAAFRRAWQRVVDRHAALRTGFAWEGLAEPLQVVRERAVLPWHEVDARGCPAHRRPELVEGLLAADRTRPVDLRAAPLLRLVLLRLEETVWQLVWTQHHLLLDGWSVPVVLAELAACYEALRRGGEPDLPRPRPYREMVEWLLRQDEAGQEGFWREELRGFTAPTPLGLDRPDPGRGTGGGRGSVEVELDEDETAALADLARRLKVTLNTLVLGAWGCLLSTYSGRRDVVFGAVTSGRPAGLLGVESMVGLFINTVPVRVRIPLGEPLADWLRGLQRRLAELRQHEHAPLSAIRRCSEVPPGQPLFESLFVFESYPTGEALERRDPGLSLSGFRVVEAPREPLTLAVGPGPRLGLRLYWDGARFDAVTVGRILGHLRSLLAALPAAGRPEDLSPLSTEERHQLLVEWSDRETASPRRPIHEVFAEQAARTPNAPALVFPDGELTYGELDRRSARWARRLRTLGAAPDRPVGVCLERSARTVVALLAVLRAGGAYLPLDPEDPPARRAEMARDAGVSLVVVGEAGGEAFADLPGARVVALNELDDGPDVDGPLPDGVTPRSLAYVNYTSGSTGRPKGIGIPHGAVCRLVFGDSIRFGPGERIGQAASLSFDAATFEVWGALLHGGTVVGVPREVALSPAGLGMWIRERGITTMFLTTALFNQVAREAPEAFAPLRHLLFGGEAVTPGWVAEVLAKGAPDRLVHCYGPTEVTTFATCQRVRVVEAAEGASSVPIGRPIADTRARVLDAELGLVPAGAPGELFLGGDGLARGYLGRPDLTAERFVPDPFADRPGERLYRTGDLVRHLPDGALEFLGRRDHQVKVRGFRIELGEVEAALRDLPAVRDAAVVLQQGEPEGRRLVAWVVPAGPAPSSTELRDALAERLPAFMIPALFGLLDSLPLGATGKVDRAALTARRPDTPTTGRAPAPPRTAAEERLAAIWRDVLRTDRVGVEDDFFELGGDSILAIQIASRAREAGLFLSPGQVFEHPTVAALAALPALDVATVESGDPEEAAEVPAGPVPLTPIQHWFFEQGFPSPHHFNQAVLLELRRPWQAGMLRQAVGRLVARHDALRLRFEREGGGWRQHASPPGGPVPCGEVDLAALPPTARRQALESAAERAQASLDLERGPLLRALLLGLGGGEPQRLFLVIHHLAVDGVSWRVILEELRALAEAPGGPARLPRATTPFRTWAERLAGWARSADLEAEVPFWTDPGRADGGAPGGWSDGADGREGVVRVHLDPDETRSLLRDVPRASRARADEALLAALAGACRSAGATRLRVDLEGHGREELFAGLDLSRTVGWFTAMYPVLLEIPETGGPGEVLRAVKERLRAVPRRGVGYGVLRYLGRPDLASALRFLPPAPVAFNYLGQFDAVLGEEGPFRPAGESPGAAAAAGVRRAHALEVSGMVAEGELRLDFSYDGVGCSRQAAERLAGGFLAELRALLALCRAGQAVGLAPSDFPLALPEGTELDRIVAELGRIEDLYPLSPLQQGFLLHSLAEPGSLVGGERIVCRLAGNFDPAAFRRAWQAAQDRHPALRSAIFWRGLREPLQAVVPPSLPLDWRDDDCRGIGEDAVARRLEETRLPGFDLGRPPLLRLRVLRLADDEWLFALDFHHILLDAWSLSLVLRDVFAAERSFRQGREPVWHGPVPRYRDYIAWLGERDLGEAEAFWREELAGLAPVRLAPAPRPGAAAGRGEVRHRIPREVAASFEALARRWRATLNTLVQGAWAVLVAQAAGREDVVFGATVSGRPAELPGSGSMVGLFINNLPVRARVAPDRPPGPWLRELQERRTLAVRHEHTPPARVHACSGLPAGTPLYDHLLVFENHPVDEALARQPDGGVTVSEVRSGVRTSLPFTLVVDPGPEMGLTAIYDARSFDDRSAGGLVRHLVRLLEGLAAEPRRLGDLPVLPESDRPLPGEAADPAPHAMPGPGPRTPLELDLARCLEAVLGRGPVGVRDDFFGLGGTSLLALHLQAEIRRRLGRDLPLAALLEAPTVEALAGRLLDGAPEPYRPLVALQADGSLPPFFCVHPAGGNVLCYHGLARGLGRDRPLWALQSREGMAAEGEPPPTIEGMAARYVEAVRGLQSRGPYHLGGWSFGALVAFEMARQLRENGEAVALLANFDQPPRQPPRPLEEDGAGLLAAWWEGEDPALAEELRRAASLDEGIGVLVERERSVGRLPAGFGIAEGRMLFRMLQRHVAAAAAFRPRRCPGGMVLFRCASSHSNAGGALGWEEVMDGGVRVVPVPGEHATLMDEPYAGEVAERLRSLLEGSGAG